MARLLQSGWASGSRPPSRTNSHACCASGRYFGRKPLSRCLHASFANRFSFRPRTVGHSAPHRPLFPTREPGYLSPWCAGASLRSQRSREETLTQSLWEAVPCSWLAGHARMDQATPTAACREALRREPKTSDPTHAWIEQSYMVEKMTSLVVTWMVTRQVTKGVTIFLIFSSVLRAHADSSDQAVWGCWKVWPLSAQRSLKCFMHHTRSTLKMMPNMRAVHG